MSGTVVGLVRIVGLVVCLALALLLLAAREANAAKYSVAQCGWHVEADASWWDSTGGAKFRPDAYCVPPADRDPFDGVHLKSFTRGGQGTVSGTRYARWRWQAPPGTAITRVSGTWWHALHDGMQHRVGMGTWGGGFSAFATAGSTDTALRNFVVGIDPPQPALEDRLLCAKPESGWCSLDATSWSGLRGLTITVEDNGGPGAWVWDQLTEGGWRRGQQRVMFSGIDEGAGVRFGETLLDGSRIHLHEYPCAKAAIGSEWRGTRMQPCGRHGADGAMIDTTRFSDGRHGLRHCTTDFAGNVGCTAEQAVAVDNNPPAHPRNVALAGGDGWRRVNDFDLTWTNPDQGPASPIGGVLWRIFGTAGYDGGVKLASGHGIATLPNRSVPGPGVYSIELWLHDEAGNEARSTAVNVPLRFDNVPPGVAFDISGQESGPALPDRIDAQLTDAHSGPASGEILYRRLPAEQWTDLPTKLVPAVMGGTAQLVARLPGDLPPGTYVFRADAVDRAGNTVSSTRRADGTEMALRKTPPPSAAVATATTAPPPPAKSAKPRTKTRLFAHLRWRRRRGPSVTVPFGAGASVVGRLVTSAGTGLGERRLRVISRPSRGAHAKRRVDHVVTGEHGGFRLALQAGPSRRVTVAFAGDDDLDASQRPALAMRVRGGVSLAVAPRQLRTGGSIALWGRVRARGAPLPRRGKLVALQYYEIAARRWRPMMVVRSDHGGRFRARYRFRYVSGVATIRLRAVALAEERWPYAPGASRPVVVRVTG